MPMTAKFKAALKLVLKSEGGNDDDPDDPGGRTSRGITQDDWDRYTKRHGMPKSDVWEAPQAHIEKLYCEDYWDLMSGDKVPSPMGYLMFDSGVLSGVGYARKLAQKVVGVKQDGVFGPITIAALNAVDKPQFINRYCDLRLDYLLSRKMAWKYGDGWKARQDRVRKEALAMTKLPS